MEPEQLKARLPTAAYAFRGYEVTNLGRSDALLTRGQELPADAIRRLCVRINQQGRGVMGVSAYLSPNSLLLLGQRDTLDRFAACMVEELPGRLCLRKKDGRWAPLHSPIIRQMSVRDRFAVSLHTLEDGLAAPVPPILSLATGNCDYDDTNARDMLDLWVDRPQRLWDAVYKTFSLGIETVVHVGPGPHIIPATFRRVRDNVEAQTKVSLGMRALSGFVSRPWLKALLPDRAALLRSLVVQHVILEDWLLDQDVS